MIFLWKNEILKKEDFLNQAKILWSENFYDNEDFANYYINQYKNNEDYVFAIENNEVVSMAFVIRKKINYMNNFESVLLITGVATRKDFLRKGLMTILLNMILKKYEKEKILIQSMNWDYYRNWNFVETSKIFNYDVVNLPFLEKQKEEKLNWEKLLEIFNNQGSLKMDLLEFKEYIHMFKISGAQFAFSKNAYVIYHKDTVEDFACNSVNDLIKLISLFQFKKIESHKRLDSKFLVLTKEKDFTKSTKNFLNICFNTFF